MRNPPPSSVCVRLLTYGICLEISLRQQQREVEFQHLYRWTMCWQIRECLTLGPTSEVDHTYRVSDHFPLRGVWLVPTFSPPVVWKWPKKMELSDAPVESVEWAFNGNTYVQWADQAVSWIGEAYAVEPMHKTRVSSDILEPVSVSASPMYTTYVKTQGLLAHLIANEPQSETLPQALRKRMQQLNLTVQGTYQDMLTCVLESLDRYLTDQ